MSYLINALAVVGAFSLLRLVALMFTRRKRPPLSNAERDAKAGLTHIDE